MGLVSPIGRWVSIDVLTLPLASRSLKLHASWRSDLYAGLFIIVSVVIVFMCPGWIFVSCAKHGCGQSNPN